MAPRAPLLLVAKTRVGLYIALKLPKCGISHGGIYFLSLVDLLERRRRRYKCHQLLAQERQPLPWKTPAGESAKFLRLACTIISRSWFLLINVFMNVSHALRAYLVICGAAAAAAAGPT